MLTFASCFPSGSPTDSVILPSQRRRRPIVPGAPANSGDKPGGKLLAGAGAKVLQARAQVLKRTAALRGLLAELKQRFHVIGIKQSACGVRKVLADVSDAEIDPMPLRAG